MTEVGAHGPVAQGFIRITGNTLLEVEQCLQIYSVLMNGSNSIAQQQQQRQ
jgi:hypothetical protein